MGRKALALTASITFGAALIGIYSKIDFNFLAVPLFIALSALIVFNFIQLFKALSSAKQRIIAFGGVVIFTLYLVMDFNGLEKKSAAGVNG